MPKISKINIKGTNYDIGGGNVDSVNGKTGTVNLIASDIPFNDTNVADSLNAKANRSEVKTKLSELTDDNTHRLVTDTEKTNWNNKLDSAILTSDFNDVSESKVITQKGANNLKKLIDNNSQDILTKLGTADILQTIEGTATNKTVSQNAIKTVVDSINQKLTQGGGNYKLKATTRVGITGRSDGVMFYLVKDGTQVGDAVFMLSVDLYWITSDLILSEVIQRFPIGTATCEFLDSSNKVCKGCFHAGNTKLTWITGREPTITSSHSYRRILFFC